MGAVKSLMMPSKLPRRLPPSDPRGKPSSFAVVYCPRSGHAAAAGGGGVVGGGVVGGGVVGGGVAGGGVVGGGVVGGGVVGGGVVGGGVVGGGVVGGGAAGGSGAGGACGGAAGSSGTGGGMGTATGCVAGEAVGIGDGIVQGPGRGSLGTKAVGSATIGCELVSAGDGGTDAGAGGRSGDLTGAVVSRVAMESVRNSPVYRGGRITVVASQESAARMRQNTRARFAMTRSVHFDVDGIGRLTRGTGQRRFAGASLRRTGV